MPSFAIEQVEPGRLSASGELSFATAAHALQRGAELIRRGPEWVLDLSRIESGDSAGLAVLIEWLAVARQGGATLRYEAVPEQVLAIARISDIEDLLLQA